MIGTLSLLGHLSWVGICFAIVEREGRGVCIGGVRHASMMCTGMLRVFVFHVVFWTGVLKALLMGPLWVCGILFLGEELGLSREVPCASGVLAARRQLTRR
jgi:hypothetical protein